MASSSVESGRRSPPFDRPNMSDLRIVLLGKNITENNRVGNFILGRAAFESEAPADVELNIEKHRGKLKDRDVTVINAPHLLRPNLSITQITQRVKECVNLSAPGPHVIILVLQQNDFSDNDRNRMKYVLNEYSKEAPIHTLVLTDEREINSNCIYQLIQECGGGYLQFDERKSGFHSEILERVEKILKENQVQYPICDLYEEAGEETPEDGEKRRSGGSVTAEEEGDFDHEDDGKIKQRNKKKMQVAVQRKTLLSEGVNILPMLNVVLCGSDRTLKSSISNLILNQRDRRSELSSECVKLEGDVHGRLITLVELPALNRLSQEEVMHQALRCVSLCDPGVHVFLLIIPDGPLTDEDKTEMEEIQKIFSSKINNHIMILIIQKSEHETEELNEAVKTFIDSFGGRHHFLGPNTQASMLINQLEQMMEENSGICFSTETFFDAQTEKFNILDTQIQQQDSREDSDDVRIVLLGKTGVGKSATGNTILGRKAFKEDMSQESVTTECQKETTEIDGRHITVIDTPGLFDTKLSQEEIQTEITNCISMILPGPHVFLFLIAVGRFTAEEENTVKRIQETFGENSLMYTIVLFTRGDDLKKKTIEEYLGKPGCALRNLIGQCGNRYHVFNNSETGDRKQVSTLLQKINDMVTANGGTYYSSKIFRQMEREKQEAQMKILMDEVEELKREREELLTKHEEEKEKMKMKMKEERNNHDAEKQRREEEFEKRREKEQNVWDECYQRLKEERDEIKNEKERIEREKDDLQAKHDVEIEKMKKMMEEERQNHDTEKRRREEEVRENEERYRKEIKEKKEQMQKHQEKMLKQHEKLTKEIQNDKHLREQQCKIYEDRINLIEQEMKDELMRLKSADYEEDKRKDMENMKLCCSQTASSLQTDEFGPKTT